MAKWSELEKLAYYNARVPFEEKLALLYCSETGNLVYVKFAEEFPSFLIGGLPGYGKSSAMAGFCCMVVLAGGQVIVLDPHMGAPRDSLGKTVAPLAPWFALPIIDDFSDTEKVLSYFQYMLDELRSRQHPGGCVGKRPLFLVVDEWAALLDRLDDDELDIVLEAVRSVAREGRKYQMWVALATQLWQLESTGGSQIRKKRRRTVHIQC
jgi:hypothetical protein